MWTQPRRCLLTTTMPPSPTVRAFMALGRAKAAKKNRNQHRAVLALLIAWFGSKVAVRATQFPPELVAALTNAGFDPVAVETIGAKLLARPLSGSTEAGSPKPPSAVRLAASKEPEMRAQYTLAALERLTAAKADGRYEQALNVEQNYLNAHVAAGRNRRQAARKLDEVAGADNRLLVWRTAGDQRVEATCRSLEGRLFHASSPPDGLIPGAVHPHCRCHAEPWGGMNVPVT